ncbi:hypothetical protein [Streptomyces sp. Ag109_O5-1]|uniref:hypothetical protein n=1 Tax=Streptomyces sp. Ag109_O5-1 TaxID=1938851 RepID=UPI0021A8ABED|nr:hypothetical protein [Streptomyces sp. Ag109_O5-1]
MTDCESITPAVVGNLVQQNTAQEGRQNNSCGNPNHLTLTATGSRNQVECVAVDRPTSTKTVDH